MLRVVLVVVFGFAACLLAAALWPGGSPAGEPGVPGFVNHPLSETAAATAAVRDVTATGMTQAPKVTGPLMKIAAATVTATAPSPVPPVAKIVPTPAPLRAKPAEPAHQQRLFRPVIAAADTIDAGSGTVHLVGVKAPAPDERCGSDQWPCGAMARAALRQLVRGRAVDCDLPDGAQKLPDRALCRVGGSDMSAWAVARGWGKADGIAYADAEKEARKAKLGVWADTRPGPQAAEVAAFSPDVAAPDASSPDSDLLINDRVSGTP